MTEEQMLRALQDDIDDWPMAVKEAGVKNAAGSSYRPVARNNEVLRTPEDPRATYEYMLRTWSEGAADTGSAGWYRIIAQAGPEYTWEWLMVDETKPYASLFSPELRERVRAALEAEPGSDEWKRVSAERTQAAGDKADRISKIQEEMRSGTRRRLRL